MPRSKRLQKRRNKAREHSRRRKQSQKDRMVYICVNESPMRRFLLNRFKDDTGLSGTGIVAEGVEFQNGKCVLSWLTKINNVSVYDNLGDLIYIHGHAGNTRIEWVDREVHARGNSGLGRPSSPETQTQPGQAAPQ